MTEQPVPQVTQADVDRVVLRDFGQASARGIHALLEGYGTESWHGEVVRVRLAVLKLAAGSVQRLRSELETARLDYRDVLAPAEYPTYARWDWSQLERLRADERQAIVDADREQYRAWLAR